jgi:hypothetical protein
MVWASTDGCEEMGEGWEAAVCAGRHRARAQAYKKHREKRTSFKRPQDVENTYPLPICWPCSKVSCAGTHVSGRETVGGMGSAEWLNGAGTIRVLSESSVLTVLDGTLRRIDDVMFPISRDIIDQSRIRPRERPETI